MKLAYQISRYSAEMLLRFFNQLSFKKIKKRSQEHSKEGELYGLSMISLLQQQHLLGFDIILCLNLIEIHT